MNHKRALVIGGNRFFGRHLVLSLLETGYKVTILNRGRTSDDFGDRVQRLIADRTNRAELEHALKGQEWDLVYDQVCFNAAEARALGEVLDGHAGRLIFTSSQSVYGFGLSIEEKAFDPYLHQFEKEVSAHDDYAEAKRQAESAFAKFPTLKPVMVRMPLVVGTDDFTGRFSWHLKRCAEGLPIYFPNEKARMGFIRSDIAGKALLKIGESELVGPVNCVCPGDIELSSFMQLIEHKLGRPYTRAVEGDYDNHSPYGVPESWTMNTDKLNAAGVFLPELSSWLSELVYEVAIQIS